MFVGEWVNEKHSRRSGIGKHWGTGMLSFEYSVGSGFFNCGCWFGGIVGGNGLL